MFNEHHRNGFAESEKRNNYLQQHGGNAGPAAAAALLRNAAAYGGYDAAKDRLSSVHTGFDDSAAHQQLQQLQIQVQLQQPQNMDVSHHQIRLTIIIK